MATIALHKWMTEKVLGEFGFSADAIVIAAAANAEVDKKQGNTIDESNLHAMGGFPTPGTAGHYRLQTKAETGEAVEALLRQARTDIVAALADKNHYRALERLGQALHTVQDREFHGLEPWMYDGFLEWIATNPIDMLTHALSDAAPTGFARFGAGNAGPRRVGIALEAGFGLADFLDHAPLPPPFQVPDAISFSVSYQHGDGRSDELTGTIGLCWGACPGSPTRPVATRPTPPRRVLGVQPNNATFTPDWSHEWRKHSKTLFKGLAQTRLYAKSVEDAAGARWKAFVSDVRPRPRPKPPAPPTR